MAKLRTSVVRAHAEPPLSAIAFAVASPPWRVDVGDDNVRALFGETPRIRFADAVRGTGDDRDFVFQSHDSSTAYTPVRRLRRRKDGLTGNQVKLGVFPSNKTLELADGKTQADVESAEQTVNRAGFVEAHLVDEFFEDQRIVGKQIDAPFPIVETDGTGNDLRHPAGVVAADHAVLAHHALALADRLAIPVLSFAAKLVHRIEAQVAALGNFRPEARRRVLALFCKFSFDFPVPFRGAGMQTFRSQLGVEFYRSFVKPELHHREIGSRRFEIFVESREWATANSA